MSRRDSRSVTLTISRHISTGREVRVAGHVLPTELTKLYLLWLRPRSRSVRDFATNEETFMDPQIDRFF